MPVNILMTVSHRVDKSSSLFFTLVPLRHSTLVPLGIFHRQRHVEFRPTEASTGINDTILNWFYGHNILGLWFTTGLLPIIYYVVSRETHTPLYSHFLSLIAFWGIALFYTGVGAHHLLWAPIPHWLQTIAVAESIGMILPVLAFMLNIYLTMRGNWNRVVSSIPLRFMVTGFVAYVLVSYQDGPHEALRSINLITHFTQYVPSHAHLSLLFFSASTIIGGAYYVIPRIYKVQIFSDILSNVQYSLYVIGFVFFFAGFIFARANPGYELDPRRSARLDSAAWSTAILPVAGGRRSTRRRQLLCVCIQPDRIHCSE